MSNQECIVEIKELHKSFNGIKILNGVNMSVRKGEILTVLGKSGTGKSVTLGCIVGLIKPDKGSVKVFGYEISELKEKELDSVRMRIGFLFQSGALYDSMSVRENLEFPLIRHYNLSRKEIDEKVIDSLENVGLLDAIDKMPSELSGGMRKRIGLARTLIMNPELILYDEPTTGLDPATTREISDLIVKVRNKYNISSIAVSHDMTCVRIISDRIVVLKDGNFIGNLPFDELKNSEDKFIKSFFI